ncbi:SDR family oxidoreductase [Lentzea sp. DG1S-22]|uniref:SDR family oxidoreductase n=1 Tax=Lentzea sp. DG1S-22 TaxID=3108822 RepID=UPI002E785907|nr:SDR family oxidoreductase [Lentzea sp. DG1S-22]WVH83532.1 SDR family oxidoreductase [Lentzea sp. DG1S-22]
MTRVAIVTGGSRGIGRAAAERLATGGTAVVVVYAGNKTAADEAVEQIRANGGQAVATQADVGDETAVAAAFDLAEETFGGVDVVVNSAGIMPLGTVADMDLDTFDRIMRTNARGTFIVSQQVARRVRDGGAIITISSSVVGLRFPQYGAYAMSKGGVEALTLVLARELRGRDITVNTVAPGPTATELFLNGKDQATVDTLAKQAPLERLGEAGDIAEVISFLAGPGRWVNGQTIRANGGII